MTASMAWQAEPNGFMAADRYPFRLVVRRAPAAGGDALFLVLRHPRDAGKFPCAILASGHRDSVAEAMAAAESVALRMEAAPAAMLAAKSGPRGTPAPIGRRAG